MLDPETAKSLVVPLRVWSEDLRNQLAAVIAEPLRDWHSAYGLDLPAEGSAHCESLWEGAPCQGRCWVALDPTRPESGLWWSLSEDDSRWATSLAHLAQTHLAEALFRTGPDSPSHAASGPLAQEVAAAAWQDWLTRLGRALGLDLAPPETPGSTGAPNPGPSPEVMRPWSGALALTFPWAGRVMRVILSPERIEALARRLGWSLPGRPASPRADGEPRIPVLQALKDRTLGLGLELRPMELPLGALTAMKVGDVLCTTHALESPLLVAGESPSAPASEPLCEGHLGSQAGHLAVELIRIAPSESTSRPV